MPLRAADLIDLAEAGQSAIARASAQAKATIDLCAQARAGQLSLPALLDSLDELLPHGGYR